MDEITFFNMFLRTCIASLGLESAGFESLSAKKKNPAARLLAFLIDRHEPSMCMCNVPLLWKHTLVSGLVAAQLSR